MPRSITDLRALLARLGRVTRVTGSAHRSSALLADSDELGDMRAAYWQVHDGEAAAASTVAMARRLPTLMRAALRLAWRASRADTIALIVCNLVAGSLTTTGLLATGRVLDHLLSTVPTVDRLRAAVPALLLVAGLATGRSVLLAVAGWSQERLRPMVDLLAEDELWQVTIRMDAAAFESAEINDAMLRARDQGTFRARLVVLGGSDLLTGLVSVAATIVTLAVLNPLLAPLAALVTVPDAWAAIRVARLQYAANRAITRVRRRMWTLGDRMADRDSAVDVRAYTFGDWLLGEWRKVAEVGKREQLAIANRETRSRLLADALTGLASVLIYVLLGVLLLTGMLSLAIAGTAVLAIRTSRGALDSVMTAVNRLYEDGLYYGDLLEFQQVAKAHAPAGTVPAPARFDQITVANVSFTYPGSDARTDTSTGTGADAGVARPPLDGVSLTIRSGEVIALVGENGSGKSTLAQLLAAIYTPTAGTITWEDAGRATDIATVDPGQLRQHITLISQDHARWPLTARTNIAMGRPRDPERLRAAAEAGRAHRLIAELPHGYGTLLDKRFTDGQDLSGGQWQRIAAARGIYRSDPGGRLIIADEPTSEVDAIAEHELLQSILALRRPDRAIVLITHRMSSVQSADRIYVLDHGRILEHGTHATLMAAGGVYQRMFTLQASRYQPASNRTSPSEIHLETDE